MILLSIFCQNDNTVLMEAAKSGLNDLVKRGLQAGAQVDKKNKVSHLLRACMYTMNHIINTLVIKPL